MNKPIPVDLTNDDDNDDVAALTPLELEAVGGGAATVNVV